MSGFPGFDEAQKIFRENVRTFTRKELVPQAKQRAKEEFIPQEVITKIADMGLMGINIPAEYGGQPADWVTWGIALEELGRVDLTAAWLPAGPTGVYRAFESGSTEEMKQEWIPKLVSGKKLVSSALTEPDCGSDIAAVKTKAIRDGDYYIINGEKTSTSFGMQADACMLFAKTDPTAGIKGLSCLLVPLDLPGIYRSHLPSMGCHGFGRASTIFEDVRIPVEYCLGGEGKAFRLFTHTYEVGRVATGLIPLGAAQTSIEEAIDFAKQRVAFGKPIASFEGISFKIAEAAANIEAARLLCYYTLWLEDEGIHHTKESAMCKLLGTEVAVRAVHDALLIHGHIGYSTEFAVEQRLRDLIGYEIMDGTADIMKLIIAREMIGKEFV